MSACRVAMLKWGSVPSLLCEGGGNAARIAWLKGGLVQTDGTVKTGVVNNKFTADWVVMTVLKTLLKIGGADTRS